MAIYHALTKKKSQGNTVNSKVSPSSRGAATGHALSPVYGQAVPPVSTSSTGSGGPQLTTYANPRATTPITPTFGLVGSAPMGTFYSAQALAATTISRSADVPEESGGYRGSLDGSLGNHHDYEFGNVGGTVRLGLRPLGYLDSRWSNRDERPGRDHDGTLGNVGNLPAW